MSRSEKYVWPFLFGLPRLAGTFFQTGLFVLTLPMIILQAVGAQHKGFHLGMISGAGALISMAVVMGAGIFADRKIYRSAAAMVVLFSLTLALPALATIAISREYAFVAGAMIIGFMCRSLTDTGLLTLLSTDAGLRPKERFTTGLVFQHFMGAALGALSFGLVPFTVTIPGLPSVLPVAAIALGITMLGLMGFSILIHRKKEAETRPTFLEKKWVLPLQLKYFLAAKICFLAGIFAVPTFLVFMVRDLMMAENVRQVSAQLLGCSLAGGLISSGVSGHRVSKKGEIHLLIQAGVLLGIVALVFVFAAPFHKFLARVCMLLFGVGFGAVMVAGTSLSVKLVSDQGISGRFMALVTMSTFFSQFLASFAGGFILDTFNRLGSNWGYTGLLVMVECFFVSSAFWVKKISRNMGKSRPGSLSQLPTFLG